MRDIIHILLSLGMWGLFAYYWYLVLNREIGPRTVQGVLILVLIVVLGLVLTMLWVGHNLRLARRDRRQGSPPEITAEPDHDFLGRSIVGPEPALLRTARIVDITVTADGCKRYDAEVEVLQ